MSQPPRILIYLLRRDLRLSDNPILHEIARENSSTSPSFTHLLPLYVFPASQIEISGFRADSCTQWPYREARSRIGGFWRCGPHRARFMAESVWDLKQNLENVGSGLFIRAGHLPEEVKRICDHVASKGTDSKVVEVWMTGEVSSEELTEQREVRKVIENVGGKLRIFEDEKYFMDDNDLLFDKIDALPDVFTTFRKSLEPLRDKPRKPLPSPEELPPLPPTALFPPVSDHMNIPNTKAGLIEAILKPLPKSLELKVVPTWSETEDTKAISAHPFGGGEASARDRVNHLIVSGAMSTYKDTRNGLCGADFSTKLSGFLAIGCLTARQVHMAMLLLEDGESAATTEYDKRLVEKYKSAPGFGQGENEGTKAVRFELLWRDYMRLCAKKFGNKLFDLYGFRGGKEDKEWVMMNSSTSAETKAKLDRFLDGRTGTALIDASQRELYLTGYSSNRARQNVASFLAKTLHFDWRLGAEWYESMLVDYDAASNWGNWQYVAGVGNDPREGRVFNPIKQALDYDPKGEYVKRWIPELRELDISDENGGADQEKLMGLFQAWRIDPATKQALNLDELDWVNDPLVKIPFSVGRKPRSNNRSRGNYRGRGGARGWVPRGRGRGGFTHYVPQFD